MTEYVYRVVDCVGRAVAVGRQKPVSYTDPLTARRHATRMNNFQRKWWPGREPEIFRVQRAAVVWEDA